MTGKWEEMHDFVRERFNTLPFTSLCAEKAATLQVAVGRPSKGTKAERREAKDLWFRDAASRSVTRRSSGRAWCKGSSQPRWVRCRLRFPPVTCDHLGRPMTRTGCTRTPSIRATITSNYCITLCRHLTLRCGWQPSTAVCPSTSTACWWPTSVARGASSFGRWFAHPTPALPYTFELASTSGSCLRLPSRCLSTAPWTN